MLIGQVQTCLELSNLDHQVLYSLKCPKILFGSDRWSVNANVRPSGPPLTKAL